MSTTEAMMPSLVALVMVQLVLCGGWVPVAGRAVLEQLAWLVPARFTFAMAAATADLHGRGIPPGSQPDGLFTHTVRQWGLDAVGVAALGVLMLVALIWAVRRSVRRSL